MEIEIKYILSEKIKTIVKKVTMDIPDEIIINFEDIEDFDLNEVNHIISILTELKKIGYKIIIKSMSFHLRNLFLLSDFKDRNDDIIF